MNPISVSVRCVLVLVGVAAVAAAPADSVAGGAQVTLAGAAIGLAWLAAPSLAARTRIPELRRPRTAFVVAGVSVVLLMSYVVRCASS